jgi:hypothetical protein
MSDMTEQDTVEPQTEGVKKLREEREQLATERAQLHRENAFLRAGVDLDTPVGKLLIKAYDGDLEVDAIRSSYSEIAPSTTTSTAPPSTEAQYRDGFMREATTSAPIGDLTESDPVASGRKAFDDRIRQGATREDASAEILTRLIDAGARGDNRVVFDKARWLEEQGFR